MVPDNDSEEEDPQKRPLGIMKLFTYFQKPGFMRRFAVMTMGVLVVGLGIALYKRSVLGNPPNSALLMAIADQLGTDFGNVVVVNHAVLFLLETCLTRRYFGAGTFVNIFLSGYAASFFHRLLMLALPGELTLPVRFALLAAGVPVCALGCALYQSADMGVGPYDALSLIMADKLPIPYFWCRMITDVVCVAAAIPLGGVVGLGTVVSAFGVGPFISFFTRTAASKLLKTKNST